MKWLAATNLLADSQGTLELASWFRSHSPGAESADFAVMAVAADAFVPSIPSEREPYVAKLTAVLNENVVAAVGSDVFGHLEVRVAGAPSATLSDAADEMGSTLLLGRRATKHSHSFVRLGAVARRAIRRLAGPLMIVPADWQGETAGSGPVVVAVDPSKPSLTALEFGGRLAKAAGRELLLAHVLPGIEELGVAYLPAARSVVLRRDQAQAAIDAFHGFVREHDLGDIPTRVVSGPTIDAVLELASEIDAFAIACGSRGLSLSERIVSASVGSELAALATVPVAIIPPDSAQRGRD